MSKLFDSFRGIGLVASGAPSSLRHMGVKNFMTVPAGRSFFVYDMANISVSLISRQITSTHGISQIASGDEGDSTFCSAGNQVFHFKRQEQIAEHAYPNPVVQLLLLGKVLIVVTSQGSVYVDHELKFELGSEFDCKFILHPHTYLNKLVFAGGNGSTQLWNFSTGRLVHTFTSLSGGGLECGEQSKVLDVCAFGHEQGKITLFHLKQDVQLFSLVHSSKHTVTTLLFQGESSLFSGTSQGEICMWNLEKQCVMIKHQNAHQGKVLKLLALGTELVVSVGEDNSIKCWEETPSRGDLRIVRQRHGHSQPPTKIAFHPMGSTIAMGDSNGRQLQLVTTGLDHQVRTFHIARDAQNKQLSSGRSGLLPQCTSLSTSEAREQDWVNMVTTHDKQAYAQVWRFEHGKMFEHGLHMRNKRYGEQSKRDSYSASDRDCQATMTCSAITNCGNFALVGNATGLVSKFNLQSGRFVHCFPQQEWVVTETSTTEQHRKRARRKLLPGSVFASATNNDVLKHLEPGKFVDASPRHIGPVSGVAVDGLDETVFSCGSADNMLLAWDCQTGESVTKLELPCSATMMQMNKEGGLLAVVLEQHSVWVVDCATCLPVRKFKRIHQSKIKSVCFSANSKWLLTSSMDSTMKVFDLSSSHCIEHLSFPSPVTSMSFSPNNEFLVTSHVDTVALCVWTNKVHFFGGAGHPSVFPSTRLPIKMEMPCGGDGEEDNEQVPMAIMEEEEKVVELLPTEDVAMTITLQEPNHSTSSRWYTLIHLDLIKQRNKPVEAPEKPALAPFFLPELASSNPTIDSNKTKESAEDVFASRLFFEPSVGKKKSTSFGDFKNQSSLTAKLLEGGGEKEVVLALEKLSPSAVDFELLSNVMEEEDVLAWLKFILQQLQRQERFDMIQALLNRMLRLHGEFMHSPPARRLLEQILLEQKTSWKRLQAMMHKSLCYVENFSQVSGF
ncbi:hypothetical protein BASA81_001952 [Batrachochytrium salamandrivorans]|nr:hypothetical protein BASA81_001952 [Batrachochytrium salamandrivorans]